MTVLTWPFSQLIRLACGQRKGGLLGQLRPGIWYASWHNMIRSPVRNRPSATGIGMVADRGPSGGRLVNGGGALRDATACAPTGGGAAEAFSQLPMGVPPVGVE